MDFYLVDEAGQFYELWDSIGVHPIKVVKVLCLEKGKIPKNIELNDNELERLTEITACADEANLFSDLYLFYRRQCHEEDEISCLFRAIRTKAKYYREENNEIFEFFVNSFSKEFDVDPKNFSEFINWEAFMSYYLYNNPEYFLSDDECALIEIIEEGSPDETVHH